MRAPPTATETATGTATNANRRHCGNEKCGSLAGRSRPAKPLVKKRDILAEIADLIADDELGVAEEVHRSNPPTKLDKVEAVTQQEQPPTPKQEKKLTYIEIKVVNDETAQPVNWVRLIIKTPDGNENFYTTNAQGLVRIDDLDPGTCDLRCDIKNAKPADTLHNQRGRSARALNFTK